MKISRVRTCSVVYSMWMNIFDAINGIQLAQGVKLVMLAGLNLSRRNNWYTLELRENGALDLLHNAICRGKSLTANVRLLVFQYCFRNKY